MADLLLYRAYNPNKKFFAPVRHYEGDAGYDLTAVQMVAVHPGAFAQVPTNLVVAFPKGYWGMIVGRSSTFMKRNIITNSGIIDNGWRGELHATVFNPGKKIVNIMPGERVCQLILFKLMTPEAEEALEVEMGPGDRGLAGFGSTGLEAKLADV